MVSEVEGLLRAYERHIRVPWNAAIAGPERVWFAVYDPTQERRLRLRLPEFETATRSAGHGWIHCDLTDAFAYWMAMHEYREAYFNEPEYLESALDGFTRHVIQLLTDILTADVADDTTVVAVTGIASLFGLTRVSTVIAGVSDKIRGRLLVFFPGQHEKQNYRLLDARDGWNYLAVPITASNGA